MTFEEDGVYYVRGIASSIPSKINHTTQQLDCDTTQYAIYTDVAQHLQWICDTTDCETDFTRCQTIFRCAGGTERLVF